MKALNWSGLIKIVGHILVYEGALCSFIKHKLQLIASGWGVSRGRSSLVFGFRAASVILSTKAFWWVGAGSKTNFWHNQWLGGLWQTLTKLFISLCRFLINYKLGFGFLA